MIEFDQFKTELNTKTEPLKALEQALDLENKQKRIVELDRMMEEPDFWSDAEKANRLSTEVRHLKDEAESFYQLKTSYEDIDALIQMGREEGDESVIPEIREMLSQFSEDLENMNTTLLLSGEYDSMNVILRLNAGAGGTEANDWAGILYRMYTRWAERHGFSVKILDYLDGDEAGIKSVTMEVVGQYAYGYLRSEAGIHRLVRISPFNAQGKRQTSFVSCDVMPDIETEIEVREEDIKMEVFRASGAGGQHINKTSSAVRLIHIPTGIVVACQEERSQLQNKNKAMQMLKTKLYLKEKEEQETKLAGIRGEVKDNGWGSQIRSYVLQPYRMVKDLRTGEETGNTDAVLDGDIDRFITAYLKWMQLGCPDRKVAGND